MWYCKLDVYRDASLAVVVASCVDIRSLIDASQRAMVVVQALAPGVEVVRVVQVPFVWPITRRG